MAEAREPFDISRIDFGRLRAEFERSPVQRTTVQNLRQAIESRLRRLLEQNPTRMDLQRHYEELVARYNRERDRLRIEETFAALLELVQGLDEEETRHLREGLDDKESLAVFDLLKKPSLSASDVRRVKKVAVELLDTLKKERLGIDHWTEKESTRDGVRVAIRDFLWSEETGLPESSYTEEDVEAKTEEVYVHVLRAGVSAAAVSGLRDGGSVIRIAGRDQDILDLKKLGLTASGPEERPDE